jgi:acyl-CoA synthetase (NDP forming)
MSSLATLFAPRSIAVVGASEGHSATGTVKMGTAAMQHLVEHGFAGPIYPVNPRGGTIMGRTAYARLADIPNPVDLALVVVPAESCPDVISDCAACGITGAVVFSSGFSEAGEDDLEADLINRARQGGVRLVGPNTAGFVNIVGDMVASISMVCAIRPFRKGPIAFLTQSGALGGSMLGRGLDQGIGFSHWIASGNEADIDTSEYLDYLVDQREVEVIALFLEGVRDADRFVAAAEKAARLNKPIVVYKTGLSEVAAAVAASHTGALAGSDRVFDGICRQYGLVRVDDLADLFPTALAFAWLAGKLPAGRNVGVVSASGGICGVAADECARSETRSTSPARSARWPPATRMWFARSSRNPASMWCCC